MDVHIDELHSTIDAIDSSALLTPQTIERIVGAVLQALDSRHREQHTVRSEIDTRSIVEQQRQETPPSW